MKKAIEKLKCQIQKELIEQSNKELNMDNLRLNHTLAKDWLMLDDVWLRLDSYKEPENSSDRLTPDEIKTWNDNMENVDGTKGGHWTVEQTSAVAANVGVCFDHITDLEFNVAMNSIYSDYFKVAETNGVLTAKFFGEMAKAFLFDPDGGKPYEKLCKYYHYIVK